MTIFNEHLGHFLYVLPDLSGFAKENLVPLGKGISMENRARIADMLAGSIQAKLRGFVPRWPIRALLGKVLGVK